MTYILPLILMSPNLPPCSGLSGECPCWVHVFEDVVCGWRHDLREVMEPLGSEAFLDGGRASPEADFNG